MFQLTPSSEILVQRCDSEVHQKLRTITKRCIFRKFIVKMWKCIFSWVAFTPLGVINQLTTNAFLILVIQRQHLLSTSVCILAFIMKVVLVALVFGMLIASSLAAYTLCELPRNRSRCIAANSVTECPACPAGRVPLACSSLGNGWPGVLQCATAKRRDNGSDDRWNPELVCTGRC